MVREPLTDTPPASAATAVPATIAAPARPSRLPYAARSFRYPGYRYFCAGATLSFSSWMMQQTARAWLTLELTNSPFLVALSMALSNLPMLFFSVLGGVFADRFDRRRLVIINEGSGAAMGAALVILLATGTIQVWHILLVSLIGGTFFALGMPTRQALVPDLVPREDLGNGIALNSSIMALAQIVGPAVGGALIGWIGLGNTFFVTAALVLPALFLYTRLPVRRSRPAMPHVNVFRNLAEGFAYIRGSATMSGIMLFGAVGTIFGLSFGAFVPVIARDYLHVGSAGLGLLMAASGIGALLGAFALTLLRDSSRWFPLLVAVSLGYGGSNLLFALSPWFSVSLFLSLAGGFMMQTFFTSILTLVQMNVPDALRGRVVSFRFITFGMAPAGQFVLGLLAEAIGTPLAVASAGALSIVLMITILLLSPPLRRL
jgi:MFS family permease